MKFNNPRVTVMLRDRNPKKNSPVFDDTEDWESRSRAPVTVFHCAALDSPKTVFKFPSLELSSALTCAVETSAELPAARGAGGSHEFDSCC